MKFIIASDIHGDAIACEAILDAAARENADRILLLGDILYHGPRNDLPEGHAPKRVIAMLNGVADKIICVKGNCEAEVDQMVLSFPVMSDTALVLDCEREIELFMTHGHKYSPENLPPLKGNAVFLSGHTHVLRMDKKDGIFCINPGSPSLPKEGNPKSYAIYDNGMVSIVDLDGNTLLCGSVM
jgi:putative phosphoesterase